MSINIYQQQLDQIRKALELCENEEDRANLLSLKDDLEELIKLENLESSLEYENLDQSSDEEDLHESKKVKVLVSS